MMSPKILITGAAGFTGRHACQYFLEEGFEVYGVVRAFPVNDPSAEYQILPCDLTNKGSLMKLTAAIKPDYVLHLAGQNAVDQSWRDPIITFESNVMSTLYLLESLRQSGKTSKIVIVGSALETALTKQDHSPHPYSVSKTVQAFLAQSWANLFHMDIVLAKPTNLIGPGFSKGICSILGKQMAEIIREKRKNPIVVNNLCVHRDFLDVRDAVRAYHVLLNHGRPGTVYNIASGNTRSLNEMIIGFQEILGLEISVQSLHAAVEKVPDEIDIQPMKALGWSPVISFEKSLENVVSFQLAQLKEND